MKTFTVTLKCEIESSTHNAAVQHGIELKQALAELASDGQVDASRILFAGVEEKPENHNA